MPGYLIAGTRTATTQNACLPPSIGARCTRELTAGCTTSSFRRYQCPISVLQDEGFISSGSSVPSIASVGGEGASAGGEKTLDRETHIYGAVVEGARQGLQGEISWWSRNWQWVLLGVGLTSVLGVGGYALWRYTEDSEGEVEEMEEGQIGPTGTQPLPITMRQMVGG